MKNFNGKIGGDKNMSDTKRCPFCGEEIKATAIKCKHCGEFLDDKKLQDTEIQQTSNDSGKNFGIGCLCVIGFFIVLGILGSFVPDTETSSDYEETENYEYSDGKVTGRHDGFGYLAVMSANYGGQMYNCLERGTGESLVEQIETFFENVSETQKPEFYSMKEYNPNLKFTVTNPHWAETINFMPNACLADIKFQNIKSDTIVGYNGDTPYTVEDVDFRVSYTVSEQSGKYKANIFDIFWKTNAGYR